MKEATKRLATVMAAILGISLLAGCAGGSGAEAKERPDPVGIWELVEATGDKEFVAGTEMLFELGGSMTIDINEDGTVLMVFDEPTGAVSPSDTTSDGTWKPTEPGKIQVDFSDGRMLVGTLKNDRFTFDVDYAALSFERTRG